MEYIYAALLLHKLGKDITEDAVQSVVAATGVTVDKEKVKSVVTSLKDVDISSELANASLASAAPASGSAPAAAEEKKEEAPKEEKKEAAADGLASLFG